jgi:hypothetical protein
MSHSTLPDRETNTTSTLPEQPGVLVVRKHHFLVRWSLFHRSTLKRAIFSQRRMIQGC